MTDQELEQLRADHATIYGCLKRERAMRERVFAREPEKLARKVAEIDRALEALGRLKDAAKTNPAPQPEQAALLPPAVAYP